MLCCFEEKEIKEIGAESLTQLRCVLYKSVKPDRELFFHRIDDFVRDAVQDVKLGIAARAADRIVILARENGIYRLIVRALPDLDGAGREDGLGMTCAPRPFHTFPCAASAESPALALRSLPGRSRGGGA